MKQIKVITRSVWICGDLFVLVELPQAPEGYRYGTIPYTELDNEGRMTRALNLLDMCASENVARALINREFDIKFRRYLESLDHEATPSEIVNFYLSTQGGLENE